MITILIIILAVAIIVVLDLIGAMYILKVLNTHAKTIKIINGSISNHTETLQSQLNIIIMLSSRLNTLQGIGEETEKSEEIEEIKIIKDTLLVHQGAIEMHTDILTKIEEKNE